MRLNNITRITDPNWGQEPSDQWGTLSVDVDGSLVTRPEPSATGDYRLFYAGVRDVLLGNATAPPVTPIDAWRVARVLEWAKQSSSEAARHRVRLERRTGLIIDACFSLSAFSTSGTQNRKRFPAPDCSQPQSRRRAPA